MSEPCFTDYFDHLEDPRRDQGKRHRLDHLLVIALCAVVAGADGWDDIATFAQAKADWLEERLDLKQGTPSGDTFRRVFSALCPEAFARGFVRWVEALAQKTAGEVIAIDGKTLRRSYEKDDPKATLHMISAGCFPRADDTKAIATLGKDDHQEPASCRFTHDHESGFPSGAKIP